MCTSVFFEDTSEHVTNMKALAKRLGCEPTDMVFLDLYQPIEEWSNLERAWDSCTCPVDIPATAAKHGYEADRDHDGDPMCYIARPKKVEPQLRRG